MTDVAAPLLKLRGLRSVFDTAQGSVRAVDGISFSIQAGSTLGIVGESGCGKSVTALSILGLLSPPGRVAQGEILFEGNDLLQMPPAQLRKLRGKSIAMIFQEPMTSLNPVYTVGQQISEVLRLHEGMDKAAARTRSIELLAAVGIPAPDTRVDAYPHELSGGMRQRVMIAMAIACQPKLLIADEPTTALDVTIQAQILDLLARLRRELGMSIMLITHDLGIVAEFVDEVIVMYAGTIVEQATTRALFDRPLHPYTQGLLASIPGARAHTDAAHAPDIAATAIAAPAPRRLSTIEGMVPDLARLPPGCRFSDRCRAAIAVCTEREPALVELRVPSLGDAVANPRRVACFVAQAAVQSELQVSP